jgi:hypothetical protein
MRRSLIACVVGASFLAAGCGARRVPEALHESKSFPATADKLVRVELSSTDVDAVVATTDQISVTVDLEVRASSTAAARRWLERHRPELEDSEKALTIRTPSGRPALYLASFDHTRAQIKVTLPHTCRLEVTTSSGDVHLTGEAALSGAVRITTASGDVHVDGGASELVLHTASGDCRITGQPLASLQFESSSGDLQLSSGAAQVIADVSSGDLKLKRLTGSLSVDSSSGDVDASWLSIAPPDKVHIETTSGEVDLRLPATARLRGTLHASTGDLYSDFGASCRHRECQLAATDPASEIAVTTTSGDISVHSTAVVEGESPATVSLPKPAEPSRPPLPEAPSQPRPGAEKSPI